MKIGKPPSLTEAEAFNTRSTTGVNSDNDKALPSSFSIFVCGRASTRTHSPSRNRVGGGEQVRVKLTCKVGS